MNIYFDNTNNEENNYRRNLEEIQKQHLDNVNRNIGNKVPWRPCMHDQCTQCHGTGVKIDGGMCVHYISCPCPKCTPTC